jgi:hypothetical protein
MLLLGSLQPALRPMPQNSIDHLPFLCFVCLQAAKQAVGLPAGKPVVEAAEQAAYSVRGLVFGLGLRG